MIPCDHVRKVTDRGVRTDTCCNKTKVLTTHRAVLLTSSMKNPAIDALHKALEQ